MSVHKAKSSHNTGHGGKRGGAPHKESDAEKLTRFKLELAEDGDANRDQREMANDDTRFINVEGGMWEGFLTEDERRVRLEFDMIDGHVQGYVGEMTDNRLGVEYKPEDGGTTKEDSDLLNGKYRADYRDNSGALSTDNAVLECATCGYGAFKLATEFEDKSDPENDNQIIKWVPVFDANNTIIWDAAAKRPDKRDASRCTALDQFTPESFKRERPGFNPVSAYDPETKFSGTSSFTRPDVIYIASRYEVSEVIESVWVYDNLKTGETETYLKKDHDIIKDDLARDDFRHFVRERKISHQIVEKTVFSGEDILEQTRRIVGKWIPVIPFYGFRSYVDGRENYRGHVRKLKDPSRLFNSLSSQAAENSTGNGQEIPIFASDQMENDSIKQQWANKNNVPYLTILPLKDDLGNIVSAGPIGYLKPGQLDGVYHRVTENALRQVF